MIAFFHQNEVAGAQGGIERYLSTLLDGAEGGAILVTEAKESVEPRRLAVPLVGPGKLPKWLRYVAGVLTQARRLRRGLAAQGVTAMELSRPEYALFSWLFPGRKVFTFHGMGPNRHHRGQRLVHDLACWLLPLTADEIQIIGRDASALPGPIRRLFAGRIVHVDAWFDRRFAPSPAPSLSERPFTVFYAGRLNEQKNPALIFEIMRRRGELPFPVAFRYFGADIDVLRQAGLAESVEASGLLDAAGLSAAIAGCHAGMLCSIAEGSPFIVVETLACGRSFLASPLPGLMETYRGNPGVVFARRIDADAFLDALSELHARWESGLDPAELAASVAHRSQDRSVERVLATICGKDAKGTVPPSWPA
jgi:glycosyltransferase involved in cell wall biosynthesis